jgi:hypothetical protein
MDEAAQVHLAALEDEVRAAALSEAGKHTALWCLGRLLPQYVSTARPARAATARRSPAWCADS